MKIFKRAYTVRRYQKTSWEAGIPSAPYVDMELMLDVQDNRRTNQGDRGGRSTAGALTVYSDVEIFAAEPDQQIDGDRLFYMGRWYVCTKSVYWGNTILKHWVCEFDSADAEEGGDQCDAGGVQEGSD